MLLTTCVMFLIICLCSVPHYLLYVPHYSPYAPHFLPFVPHYLPYVPHYVNCAPHNLTYEYLICSYVISKKYPLSSLLIMLFYAMLCYVMLGYGGMSANSFISVKEHYLPVLCSKKEVSLVHSSILSQRLLFYSLWLLLRGVECAECGGG